MTQKRAAETRGKLMEAATDLIRRKGFIATSVEDICLQSGVSKGAFFHHFKNKEEVAEACLLAWDQQIEQMERTGPHNQLANPAERALAFLAFMRGVLTDPGMLKSCLVGTTVQEVSDTHPPLRAAAEMCFTNATTRLGKILTEAAASRGGHAASGVSLAELWIATMQGALILYKATQDVEVISRSLLHIESYIAGVLAGDRRSLEGSLPEGSKPDTPSAES